MSIKKTKTIKENNNLEKEKLTCQKIANVALWALIISTICCLICGWLSGNTEITEVLQDNVPTGLLQNYNYIFGTLALIPAIYYMYVSTKIELKNRFWSKDNVFSFCMVLVLIILICAITVCAIVYPINAGTYYGINSAFTVGIFLIAVTALIIVGAVYGFLKVSSMLKVKGELWKSIKRNLPIILLVLFLIWTFISCMVAPFAADDIIGVESAKEAGATPDAVLSKTLNGCFNLKDGYWAFLMYGAFFLSAIFIGKDSDDKKIKLIKGFVIVVTILALLTLAMTVFYGAKSDYYAKVEQEYLLHSGEVAQKYTHDDFVKMTKIDQYGASAKWYIYTQRGVFRNSNHFAYVLCMAIMASAMLAIIDKNIINKLIYLLTFAILTVMLILNDTFGGYLGVAVALISLAIYMLVGLIKVLINKNKDKKFNLKLLFVVLAIFAIFISATMLVKNQKGEAMALKNIKGFAKDIGAFGGYMTTTENATEVDVSTLDNSIRKAGSGRGETWIKVWELIKQKPVFGYGLECLLFQFTEQFDVNEGRTHNLLLQLLATVGIPGTIMYFTALAIIFIRLLSRSKDWTDVEKICAFVGISYMITALTGNSTYYTSPYFMMFLGFVALVEWKRKEK